MTRLAHPSGLCRICFVRPAANGWATCPPCFFRPARYRVSCACHPENGPECPQERRKEAGGPTTPDQRQTSGSEAFSGQHGATR